MKRSALLLLALALAGPPPACRCCCPMALATADTALLTVASTPQLPCPCAEACLEPVAVAGLLLLPVWPGLSPALGC